jgi:2-dehydro-3-deoxyphosphogluconate aldolase / (4S)-4-hydroxy-2-oxoglutarate aldolase
MKKARHTEEPAALDLRQAGRASLVQRLRAARVVPIVRTPLTHQAAMIVQWLYDAGFCTFEITMTVADAVGLIRELSSDRALLVGAGTVPDTETAQACIVAGARFIVAHGSIGAWPDPAARPMPF